MWNRNLCAWFDCEHCDVQDSRHCIKLIVDGRWVIPIDADDMACFRQLLVAD
jgi:hypothetical protein